MTAGREDTSDDVNMKINVANLSGKIGLGD